ncbi:MAG: hypothetical protein ACRELG_06440 [Gemmataceae bacterium]
MLVRSDRVFDGSVGCMSLSQFVQMLQRRLAVAQKGLAEAHRQLSAGHADNVPVVLDKIDEDLLMLRHRLDRETVIVPIRPAMLHSCPN